MQNIQNDSKKCSQENLVTGLFNKMPLYSFIERDPKLNLVKIVFGFIGVFLATIPNVFPFPLGL